MRSILSFLAAVAVATAALAQKPASDEDHSAHHPDGASAPAASAKKPQGKPKAAQPAKPRASAAAASSAGMGTDMGMGGDMAKMRDQAHKPGGMHDQMHGKDGKMMGMGAGAMPAASAASK